MIAPRFYMMQDHHIFCESSLSSQVFPRKIMHSWYEQCALTHSTNSRLYPKILISIFESMVKGSDFTIRFIYVHLSHGSKCCIGGPGCPHEPPLKCVGSVDTEEASGQIAGSYGVSSEHHMSLKSCLHSVHFCTN